MKTLKLLTLAILFAAALSATAQSEADWKRSKEYTREYLEAMPAESYGLKPTPEIRSFAEQMLHLAEANYAFVAAVNGESNPGAGLEKKSEKTKEAVIKATLDSYDYVINNLKHIEGAKGDAMIKLYGRFDATKRQSFEKAYEHQSHHRGQTTVYLRLAKVTPPQEKLF